MDRSRLYDSVRHTVAVPERNDVEVSLTTWQMMQREPSFWDLVDRGIVDARQLRGGAAKILGSMYVGRAICGNIIVECQEKVPGALIALLEAALGDFRLLLMPAPRTDFGITISLLVRAFITEVKSYVADGRFWEYKTRRTVSPLIGGKIHMPTTISLRARGIRHQVAFDKPAITYLLDINRLVAAALWEIEILAQLVDLEEVYLTDARRMSAFFEDSHDISTVGLSSDRPRMEQLLEDSRSQERGNMVALAQLLLSHSALDPLPPLPGAAPIAWFLNLETLFEQAVRHSFVAAVGPSGSVTRGSRHNRRVFPESRALRADPDLVVVQQTGSVVGDVKYKAWSKSASPSDLYQLITHASVFDASIAFLIYPDASYDEFDLGYTTAGVRVLLFAVDVRALGADIKRVLERLNRVPRS
jgi:McrBC 5-methylcytosine restriction system component